MALFLCLKNLGSSGQAKFVSQAVINGTDIILLLRTETILPVFDKRFLFGIARLVCITLYFFSLRV
jgi:hypothetical protein